MTVLPPDGFAASDDPPPTDAAAREAEWIAFVDTGITAVATSADRWQAGLLGFLTIVTGALVIKGPDTVTAIPDPFRGVLIALFALAIALLIIGLYCALNASAPIAQTVNRAQVEQQYGSIRGLRVAAAQTTVRRIRVARAFVAIALAVLLIGICVWWATPAPPSALNVTRTVNGADVKTCGIETGSASGELMLVVAGQEIAIDLTTVKSIATVATC